MASKNPDSNSRDNSIQEKLEKPNPGNTTLTTQRLNYDAALNIFEDSPVLITIIRLRDGKTRFLNRAFSDLLGFDSVSTAGSPTEDLDLWTDPNQREKIVEQISKGGKVENAEASFTGRDGESYNTIFSANPISFDGEACMLGMAVDITGRIKTEATLRKSWEYLNNIINRIGDTIIVKDHNHKIVLANDSFCNFLGRKREDLIGTTGFEGRSKEDVQSLIEDDENVLATGNESQSEINLKNQNGETFILMMRKNRFVDENGNRFLVLVSRDITEQKHFEAQFLQSQKMEAIGVLAGGVAHDFNNLLNVINGYSEIVMEALNPEDPVRKDIEQIQNAGERATALTSQLLAFGRKQILKPEIVDMNEIIILMSSMLRHMIGEDIDFITKTAKNLGMIHADPSKIQQVVLNLVVNARDAMPHGGKLTIETANVEFDEDYLQNHPITKKGTYILLAISDNGSGMDPETKERIFEPFFTTKGKGRGTGLGLSTVYGIVKQSGGFIWVYSEPGKGSTFKMYFPRAEGNKQVEDFTKNKSTAATGSETILLVEDEETVRTLASRILKERGYSVMEAGEGKEALLMAEAHSGKIHLVITDVVMPGMSGKVLVSCLEQKRKNIKSLYISGYMDNAIVHHGVLDSDIAFLEKPFSIRQLTQKVREVLDS